jgi:hypothetical protein
MICIGKEEERSISHRTRESRRGIVGNGECRGRGPVTVGKNVLTFWVLSGRI